MGRLMNQLRKTTLDGLRTFIEGFCFALAERLGELSAGFARDCDTGTASNVSLPASRDRIDSHGRPSEAPLLTQPLGCLSVSSALGFEVLASLFRSQPPRVGFQELSQADSKNSIRWLCQVSARSFEPRTLLHFATCAIWRQSMK